MNFLYELKNKNNIKYLWIVTDSNKKSRVQKVLDSNQTD